jgi:hypothetical protein
VGPPGWLASIAAVGGSPNTRVIRQNRLDAVWS